jgi:hypothetical protein
MSWPLLKTFWGLLGGGGGPIVEVQGGAASGIGVTNQEFPAKQEVIGDLVCLRRDALLS